MRMQRRYTEICILIAEGSGDHDAWKAARRHLRPSVDPERPWEVYTFEINPDHIEECKKVCKDHNKYINYVEGDSTENLAKLAKDGTINEIDFAFFDSVNDGDHIFKEFKTVEHLFRSGSIVVVDDVIFADKGKLIRPYLEGAPDWKTKVFNVENGMLVSKKTS